jgi:hypothetical protein
MKITRREAFSAKALRQNRRVPLPILRINWDAVAGMSAAASALISLAVLGVAFYALRYTESQIQDFRKESQTQHLIEKAQEFNSPEFRTVRRGLAVQRLNHSQDNLRVLDVDDSPVEMFDELSFCNDLGILTRHGELTAYDVWGEFSYWLFPFYADAEGVIKASQKDAPASWSNCVYLMEQVRVVEKQEDAGRQLAQKKKDILDFYGSEMEENKTRNANGVKP